MITGRFLLGWGLLIVTYAIVATAAVSLEKRLDQLCQDGDLYSLYRYFKRLPTTEASTLFGLSALNLILFSDAKEAVRLHLEAKAMGTSTVPPLANIYLKGNTCGGMSDLFYVSAVIVKQMVDGNMEVNHLKEALTTLITLTSDTGLPYAAEAHMHHALSLSPTDTALRIRATLMTPGVYDNQTHIHSCREALEVRAQWLIDNHESLQLKSLDEFALSPTFYFIYQGYNDRPILKTLHEAYAKAFPTLGYVGDALSPFFPISASTSTFLAPSSVPKLRIGFVSAYFRRHSVCKLFCGVITDLAKHHADNVEVFVFSSLAESKEDAMTKRIRTTPNVQFFSVGRLLMTNRKLVTNNRIDVLIYLDIGMDPAGIVWAGARLAPVQMCLWGHPSTTALPHIDYYLSSQEFHMYPTVTNQLYLPSPASMTAAGVDIDSHSQRFDEQLVQFDGLGIAFVRPLLPLLPSVTDEAMTSTERAMYLERLDSLRDDYAALRPLLLPATLTTPAQETLHELLLQRNVPIEQRRPIILCPQFSPKLHPTFDDVLVSLLTQPLSDTTPPPLIVMLSTKKKRLPWHQTIVKRLLRRLAQHLAYAANSTSTSSSSSSSSLTAFNKHAQQMLEQRLRWIEDLNPQEYVTLLYLGDVMLDPFPFGGGVTVLESLSVCTPVVTAPVLQTVPQLAAGILHDVQETYLSVPYVATSIENYVTRVHETLRASRLAVDDITNPAARQARQGWCQATERVFTGADDLRASEDTSREYAAFVTRVHRQLQSA